MRFTFTWRELGSLLVSTLVLGFIFSMNNFNYFLPITIIAGTAFIIHELSHKLVAESFDCKAEYVLWPQGVLFSLIISLITRGNFIFAALGFVSISTYYQTRLGYKFVNLSLEEMGKISLAGPASNVLMGVICALLAPYYPILIYGVTLNFILALFNLVPFPPLDGSKIIMWSRMVWISMIISTSVIFGLTLLINPLIAGVIGLIVMVAMLFLTYFKDF
ncbi:MAG: hypothetical protein WC307_00705 [Candidatus Nanoarchaeia archaeon]|jgi:Zn-dependent protease